SLAWATARCATSASRSEALTASVAYLVADGLFSRAVNAVELSYAQKGRRVPDDVEAMLRVLMGLLSGLILGGITGFLGVEPSRAPRDQPSGPPASGFLLAMPIVPGAVAGLVRGIGFIDHGSAPPPVRGARSVINGRRSGSCLL